MKLFIKNRDGNEVSVVVENPDNPGKLAFVMHGLSGNKEQPHVRAMVEAFLENGYTVVTWDAVHTFGESKGGLYEDATITNYYADLEDVIAWAEKQDWYVEPFVLCGHSLGGISTALFAQKYPEKVKALAPISTVVSGKLSFETKGDDLESWKREGVQVSKSHDGKRVKRLKWSHMEDR
ncbi:MAG: alpha/beta hydrolase, partial [Actinobacteria bacterium]|nr:alpha/beta hydrolase [Actinomycetota bacterium]